MLIHITDPRVSTIASTSGLDCLWIDLEHSGKSVETYAQMVTAAGLGDADVMARPGKGEFMRMGRLLEAGAHGILYPRCDDADEAREVVRWVKFAPLGERGFDGANADNNFNSYPAGDYVVEANRQTWVTVQVEAPAAIPHTKAMAEVEGVDMVFFGPGDFSCLSGVPGQVQSDTVLRAAEQVARQTLAAGKVFGTLAFDADHARRMRDLGAMFLAWGSDQGLILQGLKQRISDFASIL